MTKPAFSETGYIIEDDETGLDSTKIQHKASTKVKPLVDRECNNNIKEKSSSTAVEEDDVSKEEPAMGPKFNGEGPNNINNDNKLMILRVAAHVCMAWCQQALYHKVVDKAINDAKLKKQHNECTSTLVVD